MTDKSCGVKLIPFELTHLDWLVQSGEIQTALKNERIEFGGQFKYAFTILDSENRVLTLFGVSAYWENRGEVWCIFNRRVRNYAIFTEVTNLVREKLNSLPIRRLEAGVRYRHNRGHRWAFLLGFKVEAERLKAFFPDGSDATLFVKIKETPCLG